MFYINHQVFILTTIISNKHYLPKDITFNILFHYTFPFVQKIIKAWRNYVAIYKTNLIHLLRTIPIRHSFRYNIYYIDLDDLYTLSIIKILDKYTTEFVLKSYSWSRFLEYIKNGSIFFTNPNIIFNMNNKFNQSVLSFVYKINNHLFNQTLLHIS